MLLKLKTLCILSKVDTVNYVNHHTELHKDFECVLSLLTDTD